MGEYVDFRGFRKGDRLVVGLDPGEVLHTNPSGTLFVRFEDGTHQNVWPHLADREFWADRLLREMREDRGYRSAWAESVASGGMAGHD